MNKIESGMVNCFNKKEKPNENETIKDDFHIELLTQHFKKMEVYHRSKEKCPFNRGNWIIDLFIRKEDPIANFCIKLPVDMTEDEILRWLKPLTDLIKNGMN